MAEKNTKVFGATAGSVEVEAKKVVKKAESEEKDTEEQIYVFKVFLKKSINRTIELKGSTSLYQFAEAIVSAFGFQFDHAFGFYDNMKDMYESNEKYTYTIFCDDGEPISPYEKSVKKSYVYKVFKPNKKMIFLFDYGDEWRFLVKCLGVIEPEVDKEYPIVTKKKGNAPAQYPDPDSDYDEDDE